LSVLAIRRVWRPDQRWLEPVPGANPSTSSLWALGADPGTLDLTDHLVYSGFAVAANVGLVLSLLGVATLLLIALYVRRFSIGQVVRATWIALAVVLGAVVLIVNEPIRFFTFEALTFVVVAGTVAGLSAAGLFLLRERTGPALEVLVVGPLAVGSVLFAVVAGGLATPTLGPPIADLTAAIVRFLLLDVLSIVGLDRPLVDLFELDGLGTVVFWIAVTAVLGWFLALSVRVRRRHGRRHEGR
jgi:hypothetical protein